MTIFRQILKVKTEYDPDLDVTRPAFSKGFGKQHKGVNYAVYEYGDGYCILELWGSDSTLLSPEERCSQAKIDAVAARPEVLEKLASHGKSPQKLGEVKRVDAGETH